jgi:aryl-alcohol dehydrogenase-like predicted oxidoreductase
MQKRHYKEGVELSIIGFGGMVVVGMEQSGADGIVAESIERGVDYFDVAPFYGDGEAERKLGKALEPFRRDVFLACKTLQRDAAGARKELERSLRRLRVERLDLYQCHAVTTESEVEAIFSPGGAIEALVGARQDGKVRFLGFSAHSVEAALAMLGRFQFDSILFPVNFVCYAGGNFGPQVVRKAKELGVARIALKALALGPWRKGEQRAYPKCWYRPIEDTELQREALRFALSEDITSVLPPGDERIFKQALCLASALPPMTPDERSKLLNLAVNLRPLLRSPQKAQ